MSKKAIFVASTGQDAGKTTACLGIFAALRKHYASVGFLKPVGQHTIKLDEDLLVDKDAVLFKNHFALKTPWTSISPVAIPPGFTRKFLDGEIARESLVQKIRASFQQIYAEHEFTLVEGSGHMGVGSIVQLNNAQVAAQLGLEVIIVASGGLGSAYDEIALNIALCQQEGVKVRGVILNKVMPEKREMILNYFPKALRNLNIPLLGCIPYDTFLTIPTLKDFEGLFCTKLLSGTEHQLRHFQKIRLVAGSLETYLDDSVPNELIITPATREDIILAALEKEETALRNDPQGTRCALLLTSVHPPRSYIIDHIKQVNLPAMYIPLGSYDAMKAITAFSAKTRWEDQAKVAEAIRVVETHLAINALIT